MKAVRSGLGHLETNPHEYDSIQGPNGEKVYEAYAESDTPGAFQIFWCYGPDEEVGTGKGAKRVPVITIVSIVPHPD